MTITLTEVSEARERLAVDSFLPVDVELPQDAPAQVPSIAEQLGLDGEELDWFGREGEPARAEFLGDRAAFVVPVVYEDEIAHLHVVVTERFLATVHWGQAGLAKSITAALRHERLDDTVAVLFLLLQEALDTFRRAAVQALLESEELEDDMFEGRRPEHVYRLAQLRRRSALLHHALRPYLQAVDEILTRRMMSPSFPEERQRRAQGLTGFFGMNFTFLTNRLETRDEFWLLAVGLQAVVLLGSIYVLHRTRIWRRLLDED
ncbi:CorA family divalent cation transporter [Streptomyces sp. NPDC003233]